MKTLTAALIAGLFVATAANAECIMRTTSTTKVVGMLEAVADINPMVSKAGADKLLCTVSFRVQYKSKWHTVYSQYTGPAAVGEIDLCVNAVELGARQFLAEKEAKLLHSEQQMVCSDEPVIKTKAVAIGDQIKLSEVEPDVERPGPFVFKGRTCRRFIETSAAGTTLYQWQGVVCQVGRPNDPNTWVVVDKF